MKLSSEVFFCCCCRCIICDEKSYTLKRKVHCKKERKERKINDRTIANDFKRSFSHIHSHMRGRIIPEQSKITPNRNDKRKATNLYELTKFVSLSNFCGAAGKKNHNFLAIFTTTKMAEFFLPSHNFFFLV